MDGRRDRQPDHYEVHLGASPQRLSAVEYTVWRTTATEMPVDPDLDRVVTDLVGRGLLAELGADGDLEDVFGRHRLLPLARGLGSTVEAADEYAVGDDAAVYTTVPPNVLTLWAFGVTVPTLWDACEQLARDADDDLPPDATPLRLTVWEVAQQLFYELPSLIRTGATFLDPVSDGNTWVSAPRSLPAAREAGAFPVVPLGLSMGRDRSAVELDGDGTAWQVRLGVDYVGLGDTAAAVWGAAFVDAEGQSAGAGTRAALVERARAASTDADATTVDWLFDRHLLVELTPLDGSWEPVLSAVQLYPLGVGMGNTPEHPTAYRIGVGDRPKVAVSPEAYAIWSYASTGASLWDACVDLAGSLDGTVNAEQVADQIGAVVPVLVAAGVAFLDLLDYVP